jgi:signal transduction histidine kinase
LRASEADSRRARLGRSALRRRDSEPPPARGVQLEAITSISRAVAEGLDLSDTLNVICRKAAELLDAGPVAIVLRAEVSETGLVVAGSYGLSENYLDHLNRSQPIELGRGPTGLAVEEARPVCVADVQLDPLFSPWRALAMSENVRALVSMPLRLGEDRVIGVLNAYRRKPGPWSQADLNVLAFIADHAAIAVRIAQLLDESRRQVRGLSLMVRSLRGQAHEHQNHLHAIYGMLATADVAAARRMAMLAEGYYHSAHAAVAPRIENPVVAGFLMAERVSAAHAGINLAIDRRSRLGEARPPLNDLDYITILGNLLHNAMDALAAAPPGQRRISVRLSQDARRTVLRVRDWGCGMAPEQVERAFGSAFSTKPDHAGLGLSIVRGIVTRARGTIAVEHPRGRGVAFTVTIPAP